MSMTSSHTDRAIPKVFGSFQEVGAAYGISVPTIYRHVAAGHIRAVKVGGRALLDIKSVDDFFQSCPEIKPARAQRTA